MLSTQIPVMVDEESQKAHDGFVAERKLAIVLLSKTYPCHSFRFENMEPIYFEDSNKTPGNWRSTAQILSINSETSSFTLSGYASKSIFAAFKNTSAAPEERKLTISTEEAIAELKKNLETFFESSNRDCSTQSSSNDITDKKPSEHKLSSNSDFFPMAAHAFSTVSLQHSQASDRICFN